MIPIATTVKSILPKKTQEDYKHALFHCPGVQKIIRGIKSTFFRDTTPNNNFEITDILIFKINYKSNEYSDQGEKDLVNII